VEALEKIAARFPTLDLFLKDKNARREYEEALTKYYGRTQFPCDSFNEVIDQVRRWVEADPSVAEKLWAPQKPWHHEFIWRREGFKSTDKYRFVNSPRRFHGIWVDHSAAGCNEGKCRAFQWNTPGRWASVLDGSAFLTLEKNDRYSGQNLLVLSVAKGDKRLRLVIPSSDELIQSRGFAGRKKKPTTVITEWSSVSKSNVPFVFVDRTDTVRGLTDLKPMGSALALNFRDASAETLMMVQPPKCQGMEGALAGKGFGSTSKESGTPSGSTGTASTPTTKALGALLVAIGTPQVASLNPQSDKGKLEDGLGKELSKNPDPQKRALAAMALDLLDEVTPPKSKRVPGRVTPEGTNYIDSYSKPARTALNKALRDPSPQVRGHAAIAIANSGGTRAPASAGGPSPELQALKKELGDALAEVSRNPRAAVVPLPPEAENLFALGRLKDEAFNQRILEGKFLTPDERKEVYREIQNGPTPEVRESAVKRLARDYSSRLNDFDSREAIRGLERDMRRESPEIRKPVLAQIERDMAANCAWCKPPATKPVREGEL